MFNQYYIHLGIIVCIYLILAQSFNLVFGLGRLLNLAHVTFYQIGAYVTALLVTNYHYSFFTCAGASILLAGVFALIVGLISLKLSGDYFAIGTLAFNYLIAAIIINYKSLTRGVLGISEIPRPDLSLFGYQIFGNPTLLDDNLYFLIFTLFLTIASLVILKYFFLSRLSRDLRSQAENEEAALSLGKDTVKTRIFAFVLSSFFAGLAGSLYAYYIGYIDPLSFGFSEMVLLMSIVVLGRPGAFSGVVLATFFVVLLPEPLRMLEIPSSILGPMRQLLFSVILFSFVYLNRKTLFPASRNV